MADGSTRPAGNFRQSLQFRFLALATLPMLAVLAVFAGYFARDSISNAEQNLRQPGIEANHETIEDDHSSQPEGERVGSIGLMPGPVGGHQCALRIEVLCIVRRPILVKEAHDGAVGDEGHDAISLVLVDFQPTDPYEHGDEAEPCEAHAKMAGVSGEGESFQGQVFHKAATLSPAPGP